jgi:hypothetical protein
VCCQFARAALYLLNSSLHTSNGPKLDEIFWDQKSHGNWPFIVERTVCLQKQPGPKLNATVVAKQKQ